MRDNSLLIEKLIQLKTESLDIAGFRDFINNEYNYYLESLYPGVLLRFKISEITEVLSIGKNIVKVCGQCNALPNEGIFGSYFEHKACAHKIDKFLQEKILDKILKPLWYNPKPIHLGSEAYYKCICCGSLWSLIEPERNYLGVWCRIA